MADAKLDALLNDASGKINLVSLVNLDWKMVESRGTASADDVEVMVDYTKVVNFLETYCNTRGNDISFIESLPNIESIEAVVKYAIECGVGSAYIGRDDFNVVKKNYIMRQELSKQLLTCQKASKTDSDDNIAERAKEILRNYCISAQEEYKPFKLDIGFMENREQVSIHEEYDEYQTDPGKSGMVRKTVTFPKGAFMDLVRRALKSGNAYVEVPGHLDLFRDFADDSCSDKPKVKEKYYGQAVVHLNLEIIDGKPKFSYGADKQSDA